MHAWATKTTTGNSQTQSLFAIPVLCSHFFIFFFDERARERERKRERERERKREKCEERAY